MDHNIHNGLSDFFFVSSNTPEPSGGTPMTTLYTEYSGILYSKFPQENENHRVVLDKISTSIGIANNVT